jgi:hypothetical protein
MEKLPNEVDHTRKKVRLLKTRTIEALVGHGGQDQGAPKRKHNSLSRSPKDLRPPGGDKAPEVPLPSPSSSLIYAGVSSITSSRFPNGIPNTVTISSPSLQAPKQTTTRAPRETTTLTTTIEQIAQSNFLASYIV